MYSTTPALNVYQNKVFTPPPLEDLLRFSVLTLPALGACCLSAMARKLRVQYPGAVYHVMNRGDRRPKQ